MTDLTVLVSPVPLYPAMKPTFTFGRRVSTPAGRPIMITLETEKEPEKSEEADNNTESSDTPNPPTPPRRGRSPGIDSSFLSPPLNTWKSRPKRPRHRTVRSQSAPPERKQPREESDEPRTAESSEGFQPVLPIDFSLPEPSKSFTAFPSGLVTKGGELIRPPPPLLRPTTFWRNTRRSGVSGPSYSPSSHLIRRSTFIAAGLTFDSPVHDLSCWASSTSFTSVRMRQTWDINYRQLAPSAPHAPQPTISAIPPVPPPAPSNIPAPPAQQTVLGAPISSFSNAPISQLSSHSSIISSASLLSTPNTTTTTSHTLPATSIITITALPPLDPTAVPTFVVHPKKSPHSASSFKLIYLAPLFAFLGLLWGSLVAWLVYGCATRKPKLRNEDQLIGGPRYVPASNHDEADLEEGDDHALLLRRPPQPPPGVDGGMEEATFSWPDFHEKAALAYESSVYKEDDPFVVVVDRRSPAPLLQPQPLRNLKPPSVRAKSTQSTFTANSDATYMDEEHNQHWREEPDLPWESLRHKSIKRGILEQVEWEESRINALRPASGTLHRSTGVVVGNHRRGPGGLGQQQVTERRPSKHGRSDSDVRVGDVHQLLEERQTSSSSSYSSSSQRTSSQAPSSLLSSSRPASTSRGNSARTAHSVDTSHTHSTTTTTAGKMDWKAGTGFRIVAEPPISREPTPSLPLEVEVEEDDDPDPLPPPRSAGWKNADDRYTHLPQRRHATTTVDRTSQSPSPYKSPGRNPHSLVLPQSPPQINSPLLHSALCFVTTPPETRRPPSRPTPVSGNASPGPPCPFPTSPPSSYDSKRQGSAAAGERRLRKLRSPGSPPSVHPRSRPSGTAERVVQQSLRHNPHHGDWASGNTSPSPHRRPLGPTGHRYYKKVGRTGEAGVTSRRAAAAAYEDAGRN